MFGHIDGNNFFFFLLTSVLFWLCIKFKHFEMQYIFK